MQQSRKSNALVTIVILTGVTIRYHCYAEVRIKGKCADYAQKLSPVPCSYYSS